MLKLQAIGRPTADFDIMNGKNGGKYAGFNFAVNEGYGTNAYTEYLQCIIFGEDAERMVNAKVKKGSTIWIDGKLRLKEFTRKDGSNDKCMNVQISDWGYVGGTTKDKPDETQNTRQANQQTNNNQGTITHFEETELEDDDLPF